MKCLFFLNVNIVASTDFEMIFFLNLSFNQSPEANEKRYTLQFSSHLSGKINRSKKA